MTKDIVLLELFSGIGGFTKGFLDAGYTIKKHYFSEIDKHAIANYKYNFKDAEYVGSVTELDGTRLEKADVMTFGFPCQDLSLAGKRLGFKGKRSSLFYQAARVLRENQSDSFIWENVAGLLSSNNGSDLDCVIEELYLSGYLFDINLINGVWFLPQNRLRLYSIGYNIKYLHKCISDQNGVNTKLTLFVKVMEGILLTKYPEYLTGVQNPSDQRQKDLVLEFVKTKEQSQYLGKSMNSKFLKVISCLPLQTLRDIYQTAQLMLSRQCDLRQDVLIKSPQNTQHKDIKSDTARDSQTAIDECILSIEILLNSQSEELLTHLNRCIILTLINQTTISKTFSYAEMQLNIDLFIIQLTLLYPDSWNLALSNLIERKKNINYAENRRAEGKNAQEDNNNALQLSITDGLEDDAFGHLDGRSKPGVFPIGEENRISNSPYEHTEKQVASCLQGGGAGHIANGEYKGMNLICAAQHGRNPENPSDSTTGSPTEQRLEINSQGTTNTLTGVTKDNLILVGKLNKSQDGKIHSDESVSQTLSSGHYNVPKIHVPSATSSGYETAGLGDSINFSNPNSKTRRGRVGKGVAQTLDTQSNQGVIAKTNSIRRLTEVECERLQGFPDNEKSIIFEICLDTPKNPVSAEQKKAKSQNFAGIAEKTNTQVNALYVDSNTNIKQVKNNKPVQSHVHIRFGLNGVEILSQGKSLYNVKTAENKNLFHPLISQEDFVLQVVVMHSVLEKGVVDGRVVLQPSENFLILQENGKSVVRLYGSGITQLAENAEIDLITHKTHLKSTTLDHLDILNLEQRLKTLFCFVAHAISGYIPEGIKTSNSLLIEVSVSQGWTEYGIYDGVVKKIPKTQRYKMCGNAVMVDCVKVIAERLELD